MRLLTTALAACVAGVMSVSAVEAADAIKFRISLETGPNHVRNISLKKFVDTLKEKSAGKLEVELYEGAALYKDRDVPKALAQGNIEMALPGAWQLDKFVPEAVLADLPMFYGATPEQIHAVMDGEVGQELNRKYEAKLGVKVIGRSMDLGYVNLYGTQPINSHADVVGKKVRIPGGAAAGARFKVMGANPVLVPWPDVPLALTQGTVDAVITTYESIRSAKLWDSGLKSAYEDKQTLYQYVPMVSGPFWKKLSPDLQKLITGTWEESIDEIRALAAKRQKDAREEAEKHGIVVVEGKPADLAKMREKLLAEQDQIAKDIGMDPEFVARAKAALAKAM